MPKATLPGLSALALIALALALGVFVTLAVPFFVFSIRPDAAAWLGFSGSCLTAALTTLAIWSAGRNVRRQLRMGLLVREEERIEKQLPGLNEVAGALDDVLKIKLPISNLLSTQKFLQPFRDRAGNNLITARMVAMRIPQAQSTLQQSLLIHLQIIEEAETEARRVLDAQAVGNPGNGFIMLVLNQAVLDLKVFRENTIRKIRLYEERLPRFREEIEAYFDRPQG